MPLLTGQLKDSHFILGDAHTYYKQVNSKYGLKRFRAAGNFIATHQPKAVVVLGDWITFDSISYFTRRETVKGAKVATLVQDMEAAQDAFNAMMQPIVEMQKTSSYRPKFIFTEGNHEYRLNKYIDQHPELEGLPGMSFAEIMGITDKSIFGKNKAEIAEYKKYAVLDDIQYTHVPINRRGKEYSGITTALQICRDSEMHTVYGHSHRYDFASLPLLGEKNQQRVCYNAGSFMDTDNIEEYAEGSATGWTYGALILTPTGKLKAPDSQFISTNRLIKNYV